MITSPIMHLDNELVLNWSMVFKAHNKEEMNILFLVLYYFRQVLHIFEPAGLKEAVLPQRMHKKTLWTVSYGNQLTIHSLVATLRCTQVAC